VGHPHQDQLVLEDAWLDWADSGESVGTERGEEAEVARRLMATEEDLRDMRSLSGELLPYDHPAMIRVRFLPPAARVPYP
jgi:hypothetical protein